MFCSGNGSALLHTWICFGSKILVAQSESVQKLDILVVVLRMNVMQWKSGLARREGLPADLQDAMRMYPKVASICCKRHCYGILLLFLALKMPTARDVFLQCWKKKRFQSTVSGVFTTLSEFASLMSERCIAQETKEIGGPLYAHRWQMLLRQLCVIGSSGKGKMLSLDNTETSVRLQTMSNEATRCIRAWLDMHVAVFAVIKMTPPSTVEAWKARACILYEAFKFHQVPGMLVGGASYSCQWLVRTFLVSFMRSENVSRLEVGWGEKICDLNGPDQGGHVQNIAEQCKVTYILGLMKSLHYDGPPELLSMYLCLVPTADGGVKRKRKDLAGDRDLVAGRMFQTRVAFLRDTCGITNTRQPAYQKILNANFDAGNIIVFPQVSKFKICWLSSAVREGTVDVVPKGIGVLWSSLDRRARASFDEDSLYAYDVDAMRNICEERKMRKK